MTGVISNYNLPCYKVVKLKGHDNGSIRSIRFNSDGKYCITCGTDRSVRLWNPLKNVCLKVYSGHGHEVLAITSSTDNSYIVSGSKDKSVIQWDVLTGQALRRLRHHHSQINCVKMNNEECSVIFSGSTDNTVCVWDTLSRINKPVQILNQAKDAVLSIDVYNHTILTGSVDGCFRIYDLRKGQITEDYIGAPISCSKYCFEGNSYIGAISNNTLKLMDASNGKILNTFEGHKNEEFHIECDVVFKDSLVCSGSDTGYIFLWDLVSGKVEKKIQAHSGVAYALDFHPEHTENGMMLSAGSDGAFLWANKNEPTI